MVRYCCENGRVYHARPGEHNFVQHACCMKYCALPVPARLSHVGKVAVHRKSSARSSSASSAPSSPRTRTAAWLLWRPPL